MVTPCVGVEGPCRETLQLMPEGTAPIMYGLFALSLFVFGLGFYLRYRGWRRGGKEVAWDHPKERLRNVLFVAAAQTKTVRKKYAGPMHAMIFYGFTVLFIGTVLVLIDYDITLFLFHVQFLVGSAYLLFELVLDAAGIVFLTGVVLAIRRRLRPNPTLPIRPVSDFYVLATFVFLGIGGFLIEAVRLAIRDPPWGTYSFVGMLLRPLFDGMTPELQLALYRTLWWSHALAVFAWIATIPYTQMRHIFTSPLNIFFATPYGPDRPKGELPTPFSLEEALATGNLDIKSGATKLEEFSWKTLLQVDACTECARCTDACPAYAAGRPLSPMHVVLNLRNEMHRQVQAETFGPKRERPTEPGFQNQLVNTVIQESTLWSCVTCRACMNACPVNIEHVPIIVDLRRGLVNESRLDTHKNRLLTNLANTGNAYGFPASDRASWAEGLDVPILNGKDPGRFEVLYWVGCAGSYDARNQKVSRAFVEVMRSAGVKFAILGNQERCTGDPARRLGEEGRFQELVLANKEILKKYEVTRVVTQCPHCFNTLKNEYARFGVDLEVEHHTQFMERLVRERRLDAPRPLLDSLTYHDPCYLGRYNDEYDAPRRLIQLMRGKPPDEMPRHREHSFCCGAGGSNMWFEVKEERERISVIRYKEAQGTGARRLGVACPFCMTMFEDAKRIVNDEGTRVQDMAELVAESLDRR